MRHLVAEQLKDTPNCADNRIAREIGVDGKTVENVRAGNHLFFDLARGNQSALNLKGLGQVEQRGQALRVVVAKATSMGRLTLNVLLSFAQFEREVIGERIRDKIAASKQKGMWMGDVPPLGYRVEDRRD
jgi:hypothetical protein